MRKLLKLLILLFSDRYSVTITKKHLGGDFTNPYDCPGYHAFKSAMPPLRYFVLRNKSKGWWTYANRTGTWESFKNNEHCVMFDVQVNDVIQFRKIKKIGGFLSAIKTQYFYNYQGMD